MNILINGVGNIGTTLLNILNEYRELLGIKEIYAKKKQTKIMGYTWFEIFGK